MYVFFLKFSIGSTLTHSAHIILSMAVCIMTELWLSHARLRNEEVKKHEVKWRSKVKWSFSLGCPHQLKAADVSWLLFIVSQGQRKCWRHISLIFFMPLPRAISCCHKKCNAAKESQPNEQWTIQNSVNYIHMYVTIHTMEILSTQFINKNSKHFENF